jgi:hypothetical protein
VLRRLRGAAAAARALSWAAAEVDGEALRVAALLALLEGEGERDAKVSALLCLPALLALLDQDAEQVACFRLFFSLFHTSLSLLFGVALVRGRCASPRRHRPLRRPAAAAAACVPPPRL